MSGPQVEVACRPANHIHRRAHIPESAMHTGPVKASRGIVRQDDAKVEIAVRTVVAAGRGTEQVDPLRVEVLHQAASNFGDYVFLSHPSL